MKTDPRSLSQADSRTPGAWRAKSRSAEPRALNSGERPTYSDTESSHGPGVFSKQRQAAAAGAHKIFIVSEFLL
jgi:hypothetical protein